MILSSFKQVISIFSFLIVLTPFNNSACTVFSIKQNNQLIMAKNLDWAIDDGLIFINKKGIKKFAHTSTKFKLEWTSKYGSITFNQFGKEFPLGGINEEGLVVEELNNWGEVPETDSLFILNEFQIVQYILDNYSSTKDLENLKEITISPLFINLHYFITDKDGNRAVLEYYDKKMFLYYESEIPYPVLSNNHYVNSLKYLDFFKPFGGDQEIPDSKLSNDRFLKTAYNIKALNSALFADLKVKAFEFLDNVKQDDTQWSIVYDISNMKIYFRTKSNSKIRQIDFNQFNFSCESSSLCYKISNNDDQVINDKFIPVTSELNKNLLLNVYEKYRDFELGEIKKEIFVGLYEFGNKIKCE